MYINHKKYKTIGLLLLNACLFAGCGEPIVVQQEEVYESGIKDTENAGKDNTEEVKDDDIEIDGTTTTSQKIVLDDYQEPVKITNAGTYTISGSGQMVIVDAKKQDVNLILDNVSLENESLPALYIKKAASVTIELQGENKMKMGSTPAYEALDAALYSKADLILKGTGTLTVDSAYEHAIKAKDTAVFEGGVYTLSAPNDGIHVNETATFKDGTYTIDVQGEGIESKDTLVIDGGTYTIHAKDDAINASNSLTINGGTVTAVSANNDGIDSNGDLIINGGDVTAIGSDVPETSFDTDNTPLEFNGGKILGIGATGIAVTSAKQPVIQIQAEENISAIELKNTSGESVVKWDVPAYSSRANILVLSDASLKQKETYDLYVNGEKLDSITLSDQITTVGNIQTMGGPGGKGQRPGNPPADFNPDDRPEDMPDFDPQNRPDFSQKRPQKPGNRPDFKPDQKNDSGSEENKSA